MTAVSRRIRERTAFAPRRALCALAIAAGLLSAVPAPAVAQDVQRIAAVVNDEIVSIYDVRERADLLIFSAGLPNNAETRQRIIPQVLRGLIDETLQKQEAERQNIRVTQGEMDAAIARIEQTNNIPAGAFDRYLQANGISVTEAYDQIRNNLAWQKLLARRVAPQVEIGEEEIDDVLQRIENSAGQTEYRVAEILLPVDNPSERPQVQEIANRLVEQLRSGADFAAVAQQFSKSASAATGGDIGWIQKGEMGGNLDNLLANLDRGDVADPIETPDGLLIVKLLEERRNTGAQAGADASVKLRQLLLPLAEDAPQDEVEAQIARAREATASLDGCPAFAAAASELGTAQPDAPAEFRLADLNAELRPVATSTPVGEASEPMRRTAGIQVVMICERDEGSGPNRDQIRENLRRERMDMLSRRYLRDLRRAAFVDVRV